MRRAFVILARVSVLISLVFCWGFFGPAFEARAYVKGDVDGDGQITLVEALHALQVVSGIRSALAVKEISVPEDIPTIQQAIDAAAEGDTIRIAKGIYTENLLIRKNFIRLVGAGPEETIIQGESSDTTISLDGATGVSLQGFSIKGGIHGIHSFLGAAFIAQDLSVEDAVEMGIRVGTSNAVLIDCTVKNSGRDGIFFVMTGTGYLQGTITSSNNAGSGLRILQTSGVFLRESTKLKVQKNAHDGIRVMNNSSLVIPSESSCLIADSGRRGLQLEGSSDFQVMDDGTLEVKNNNDRGINITTGSVLHSQGTVLVDGNKNRGISVGLSSSLNSFGGSLTVRNTSGNPGRGIHVFQSQIYFEGVTVLIEKNAGTEGNGIHSSKSTICLINMTKAEIKDNKGHGIHVNDNSDAMIGGVGIEIQNNGHSGVFADSASVLNMWGATVSGNTHNDVVLEFGSQGTFNNSHFDQSRMYCGQGVLTRGDRSCP